MMRYVIYGLTLVAVLFAGTSTFADDLEGLSDEFESRESLAQWQRVYQVEQSGADQLERYEIDRRRDGRLVLMPFTSVWYKDYRGVLVFKPVEGDFVVTTSLRVRGRNGQDAPRSAYSLAGLMVRTPREVTPQTWQRGGENYVFLSMGAANQPGNFQLEVKTTRNSNSQLQVVAGSREAELRSARVGSTVILLRRLAGQAWQVHQRYDRPDMPQTVQVGLTCYTDWNTCKDMNPAEHNRTVIRGGRPDLIAEIDYMRFARPSVPEALQGRNLADASQVSDAELLAFLGDAAD